MGALDVNKTQKSNDNMVARLRDQNLKVNDNMGTRSRDQQF